MGALDRKHVAMRWQSGSRYCNYKGFNSVVQLTLVDADYMFVLADVGSNGCCSDDQIFKDCQLKETVMDGTIGFTHALTVAR